MKFFAIFFLSELVLHPVSISALGAAGPVCISLASITSQKLSKRCAASLPMQVQVTRLQQIVAAALASAPQPASLAAALRFCWRLVVCKPHTEACIDGSCRVGRVQLSLVTRLLDVGLLMAMALLPATASAQSRATMITLHLCRTSMANCTRPLMRSLMMDNVPKRHRGAGNTYVCTGLPPVQTGPVLL